MADDIACLMCKAGSDEDIEVFSKGAYKNEAVPEWAEAPDTSGDGSGFARGSGYWQGYGFGFGAGDQIKYKGGNG